MPSRADPVIGIGRPRCDRTSARSSVSVVGSKMV
jgi:hypothetical protein